MGRHGILYGDKVMNVRNSPRDDMWPEGSGQGYVANGEVGIVVGQYKGKSWKPKKLPWKLEVEFSSQKGAKYGYGKWEFTEEGDQPLALAYALTIQKSQGSEFETALLVVPNPCRLLSPELLYTALTRQRQRIVLLHQGPLLDLKNYSRGHLSETARRNARLGSTFLHSHSERISGISAPQFGASQRTVRAYRYAIGVAPSGSRG